MEEKDNQIKEGKQVKKSNKTILIVGICLLVLVIVGIFVIYNILYNNKMDKNVRNLQAVLKEKDELYKSLTTPQPYCGKNRIEHTTDIVAPNGEYSQYIMYWSLSNEFQTYNQLLNFVSENMTENMIQVLKSKNNNTFNENLYMEKDNKLYCGHVGAGYYPPEYTLYRINKYDDNKIIGTATDVYDDETVSVGIVKKSQYQNDIILVKENNIWKIDSYESELVNESTTSDNNDYSVKYEQLKEESIGSGENKITFNIINGYLNVSNENNNYKLDKISDIDNILLFSPTSADNAKLFVLTKTGKVYVISKIYDLNNVNDFDKIVSINQLVFNEKIDEIGVTRDYVNPPIAAFLVVKSNDREYLFIDSTYNEYVEINNN